MERKLIINADDYGWSRELAARQKLPPFIIRLAGHRLLKTADRFGISHPDYFIPEFSNGDNQARVSDKEILLQRIFDNLQPGISELLTHPSLADDPWRQIEHEAWIRFGETLKPFSDCIEFCDYRALSPIRTV
ncbi:MAG: hypothetical protein JXR86_16145 [Spirochaetales bacterium]|nr:hypothetical protein [Spirochaetales bacterium]